MGIIGKDGAMAELVTLPAPNLHVVPDALCDDEAVFAEPLAAACRIHEQGLPKPGSSVAVVGDGKLGLLVAQVLVCKGDGCRVTLLGRHPDKMALVSGLEATRVVDESTAAQLAGQFDMTVEASGSSQGIKLALALTRPLGTVLLKSTVSLHDPSMPGWSEVANDVVVNEKVLVGSRCGPFDVALRVLEQHAELRTLVRKMTHSTYHISRGVEAMATAQQKGTLKVLLRFDRLRPSGLTEEQRIAGK